MKKRLENFWYYYKLQTLIGIGLLIGIIICTKSCIDRDRPDIYVAYIGDGYINTQTFEQERGVLEAASVDVNGDGEVCIGMMAIMFDEQMMSNEMAAMQQKLMLAMGYGEARVYLMERPYAEKYAEDGMYADLSEFLDETQLISALKSEDGVVYAASLRGNALAETLGIPNTDNLYLTLRIVSEVDESNKQIAQIDEAARAVVRRLVQK